MTSPPCAMLAEGATLAPITTPPSEALAEQKRPSAWPSTDTEIAWDTESYAIGQDAMPQFRLPAGTDTAVWKPTSPLEPT